METPSFYSEYTPQQLMPATGWRAVFHDIDGAHVVHESVHMLALASYVRKSSSGTAERTHDTGWDIVALSYHPERGWMIEDEAGNYCGLLPPGKSLAVYEEEKGCDKAVCAWPQEPERPQRPHLALVPKE
jgi:hypothetical protein